MCHVIGSWSQSMPTKCGHPSFIINRITVQCVIRFCYSNSALLRWMKKLNVSRDRAWIEVHAHQVWSS